MVVMEDSTSVKVYTVNGAASGSSSSLPDWLTRKRAAKKGKRAVRERVDGTIDLVQEFEFPEASNRIRTTRDGHHAIATGVYKPQMRVYDLDQLTLKFERHSDAENMDFAILSDDWTKTIHLQADRSIELHTQGGFYYRTRIPRFGRAIAYHFPSCDALVAASGSEIYRLNLDQGRFLSPLVLTGDGEEIVSGVNAIDINPAHQLLAFGVEGNGMVEFWDPRSRARVGVLRVPVGQLSRGGTVTPTLPGVDVAVNQGISVTALASRSDGLSYAVGTSTGHTLLYDIRSPRPLATKDLGYGLPVKKLSWIEGGSRMAGDGMVLSADKKVIKIWDRNNPTGNFASVTPAYDINDVHHLPGSGMLMLANEGIQMTSYYIPQLGPAPRWCSFLDNITEELEDQTVRNVYEDYKFVERDELTRLGLDHLVGTPALKPYMHGYFLSLRLYDAARVIANPFAYAEHREKLIQAKMEKLAETRIRTRKDAQAPKVNKMLAERIRKEEERERRREEKKRQRKAAQAADNSADVEMREAHTEVAAGEEDGAASEQTGKPNLLSDPRFKDLFENPEYEVDENSREFGLLNPSLSSQQRRGKTAVEEEEEESDKPSSDGISEDSDDASENSGSEDSSDAGDLDQFNPRARPNGDTSHRNSRGTLPAPRRPTKPLRMVAARPEIESTGTRSRAVGAVSQGATFGQRRKTGTGSSRGRTSLVDDGPEGIMEHTWVPGEAGSAKSVSKGDKAKRRGVETFGAGMERGGAPEEGRELSESERQGRTRRRSRVRSGSKNTFRRF